MGYSIVPNIDQVLAQALTQANPDNSGEIVKLVNINTVRDLNRIPTEIVEQYITFADNQIDGILSEQYVTPLKKCANGQWRLDVNLNEYNSIVEVTDAANLVAGQEILIYDDKTGEGEYHIVQEVLDRYRFSTVETIEQSFAAGDTRVIRVQYPPPIEQISARLAAASIYDKYFAAQNSPNVSDYGKEMRKISIAQLNDILNGKSILKCQKRKGDRFASPYLSDTYHVTDRGFDTTSRDMSDQK